MFRTAAGTKLAAARDQAVAFEIDDYDARSQQATSVIVSGRAEEITEVEEWENSLGLPLVPVGRRAKVALRSNRRRRGVGTSLPGGLRRSRWPAPKANTVT